MAARPGRWASTRHSIDTVTDGTFALQTAVDNIEAWGTANRATYVPVRVSRRVIVRKLAVGTGTTGTNNLDIGLYDAAGTRLVSTGPQAKGTTLQMQTFDVTDTTIGPGLYYLALNSAGTTDTFFGALGMALGCVAGLGLRSEAVGAVTLPATATWVVANALQTVPLISALTVTEVS
jgi:hypothetical protein